MWRSSWKGHIRSIKVKWAHVQIELGSFKVKRIRLDCRLFGVSLVIWGQFKPMTFCWPFGHPRSTRVNLIHFKINLFFISQVQMNSSKKIFWHQVGSNRLNYVQVTWCQGWLPRLPCHMTHIWLITWYLSHVRTNLVEHVPIVVN